MFLFLLVFFQNTRKNFSDQLVNSCEMWFLKYELWAQQTESSLTWNLKEQGSTALATETRSPLTTGPDFRGGTRQENVWFRFDVYFEHVKTKLKESKVTAWDFYCRQMHSGIKEKSNVKNMTFFFFVECQEVFTPLVYIFLTINVRKLRQ